MFGMPNRKYPKLLNDLQKTGNMDKSIISVNKLSKKFGSFSAVKDISFEVKQSEIFAYLGPNGAGKSTTIKMFITLLAPTSGDAIINDKSLIQHPAEVRKSIGYVPQMISVDGSLTVQENMMLMAQLYDVPYRECKGRIQEMLTFLNLDKHARTLVRTLSGGMIRKLEIGQAMIHHPRILFLMSQRLVLILSPSVIFGSIWLICEKNLARRYSFQRIIWKKPKSLLTGLRL